MRTLPVFLLMSALCGSAAASQPPAIVEWGSGPVVGDLTGSALGGIHQGRFDAMHGLRLDSVDGGVRLAPGWRFIGRIEVGVDEDRSSREVVMGAFEMGLRLEPYHNRFARTFVSVGGGWVGGGFLSPDALALGEHVFDPQIHVLGGVDLRLQAGWSFELRLPFRYLWGPDLPLAAATVGFRHEM